MISGQKCLPEAELVAGKFGNPTLVTMYNVHYARMKLIQVFIGPIFFIADNDNNFEFIGDTDI